MPEGVFALSLKEQSTRKNNMKTLTTLILFFGIAFAANAKDLTIEQKKEFADFYREQVDLLQIHPNKPQVKVIFVDLDDDGAVEAFATSYEGFYETGWLWTLYKQSGDGWTLVKRYDAQTKAIQPSAGIYARPGEVFRLRDDEGHVEFVVLNRNYDKLAPGGVGTLNKNTFHLDEKGIFREEKVENLESLLAYRGGRRAGIVKSLEALQVEEFSGADLAKNQEQNKAQHPTDGAPEPEKPTE